MGEVWRAWDQRLQRVGRGQAAQARVLQAEAEPPARSTRFRAEARHAAALSHPGIAAVYDYGETSQDGQAYLVMELVEGEPLSRMLARRGAAAGRRRAADRRAHRAGAAGGPRGGGHPPRHQAGQPDHRRRADGTGGQDHRLRHRPYRRLRPAHPYRHGHGHRPLPLARAGPRRHGHAGERRLLARRRRLRDASPAAARSTAPRPTPSPPPTPTSRRHRCPTTIPPAVRDLIGRALAKEPADRPASAGELGRAALALAVQPYPAQPPPPLRPAPAPPTAVLPAVAPTVATRSAPTPSPGVADHRRGCGRGSRRGTRADRDRCGQGRQPERGCQPAGGAERRYQTGHQATTTRSRPRRICRSCATAAGTVTGMHPGRPACGHHDETGSRGGDGG